MLFVYSTQKKRRSKYALAQELENRKQFMEVIIMPKVNQCGNPKMVPYYKYEDYREKFKDLFMMERTESGVLTAKWHDGNGDSAFWDYPLHRGIHQLCWHVGQDAETEVLILGGAGKDYLKLGATSLPEDMETQKWSLYEHSYYDGTNMVEALVNDVEQPTIGILNGGMCVHTEISLLCDITLMAEDAVILDPHFGMSGAIPGDGIQIAFRAAMGTKRSNYAMMFGEKITAEMALEYGMVNEVVPGDKIYERALELAEQLAKHPRMNRRMLSQVLRMPIKEQIAKELRMTFGAEMWGMMSSRITHDEAFDDLSKDFDK